MIIISRNYVKVLKEKVIFRGRQAYNSAPSALMHWCYLTIHLAMKKGLE